MAKKYYIYLNFGLSIVCFAHIGSILHDSLTPHAHVRVFDKKLGDIEFPLIFKLCLHEIEDSKARYQRFGYYDVIQYYRGRSMFNESLVGWFGHTENESTAVSSAEGSLKNSKLFTLFSVFFQKSLKMFHLTG